MGDYTDLEKAGFELNIARKAIEEFAAAFDRLPPEIKVALTEPDPRQAQLPEQERGLVDRESKPL